MQKRYHILKHTTEGIGEEEVEFEVPRTMYERIFEFSYSSKEEAERDLSKYLENNFGEFVILAFYTREI